MAADQPSDQARSIFEIASRTLNAEWLEEFKMADLQMIKGMRLLEFHSENWLAFGQPESTYRLGVYSVPAREVVRSDER